MGVRLVTVAVALVALAMPMHAVAAVAVESGAIRINRSVAGVTIGDERSHVVDMVGAPLVEYGVDTWGWNGARSQFGVSFEEGRVVRVTASGRGTFCIRSGVCLGSRGGVGYLRRRFGARLRFLRIEDGSRVAIVTGRLGQRRVFTIFGQLTSTKTTGRFRSVLIGDCDRGISRPC